MKRQNEKLEMRLKIKMRMIWIGIKFDRGFENALKNSWEKCSPCGDEKIQENIQFDWCQNYRDDKRRG